MTTKREKPLILVAEDEVLYGKIYQNKFTKEGFEVVLAKNGLEALEMTREKLPDLLLLDLIMPEMDGFQVLSKLKEDPKTKSVRVIVLSNLGQASDMETAKNLGAEGYFVKSNLSISELVAKVKELLG